MLQKFLVGVKYVVVVVACQSVWSICFDLQVFPTFALHCAILKFCLLAFYTLEFDE